MAAPRGAAHDPQAVMAEAAWWREMLGTEPDDTGPLLIAWAAWRWADAARRLVESGGRERHIIAVLTLLAHARVLLDLLDAGRLDAAVTYHARATHRAETLSAETLGANATFLAWRRGSHSSAVSPHWATALWRRLRPLR